MSKFKKGDIVAVLAGDYSDTCWVSNMDAYFGDTLTISLVKENYEGRLPVYEVYGEVWEFPEECLKLVESSTITEKHTYTGEWINIDDEQPPFGVEVFLFLPEEDRKMQTGSLKYIGEGGLIFKSSTRRANFPSNAFLNIKGEVKMWTIAPPLPDWES